MGSLTLNQLLRIEEELGDAAVFSGPVGASARGN